MTNESILEKKQRFEFWKNHVDLALKSKSISKYCLENNIKHSTLHGYKKKFYPELYKPHPPKIKKNSKKTESVKIEKPTFKKIEIKNNKAQTKTNPLDKNSPEFAARFLKEFLK